MTELSLAQIAARLGISERTARRWITDNKLHTEPGRRSGYFIVNDDQLEQLERNNPNELTALRIEVANLRKRVETLERQAWEPNRSKARRLPPVPENFDFNGDEPGDGLVIARAFAEAHGFTRERMNGWIKRGEIQTTSIFYGRGNHVQHKLTPAQERAAILFWEREGIEHEHCPRCPHELTDE